MSVVVEEAVESSTNTAGTSHTITAPTWTANQLLIIILDKGSTSATITQASGPVVTELLDEASGNGLYMAYRFMQAGDSGNIGLTSSASTRTATIAYRISGASTTKVPEIGTTGTGTSATPDPPTSATPSATREYLFIAFAGMAGEEADDDTWGNTAPTNYTPSPPRQKSCGTAGTNLGGLILSAERLLSTGSAENPGTFGVDASAAWRSQTIMVYPALPIDAQPGTFAVAAAGGSGLLADHLVSANPASFAIAGVAASVPAGRAVSADLGAYSAVGFANGVLATRTVDAQPTGYAVSGVNAGAVAGRVVDGGAGSYSVSGSDAAVPAGRAVAAALGTYAVSGADLAALAAKMLDAAFGTYALSGADGEFPRGFFLALAAGDYTLAGSDASVLSERLLSSQTGAFVITGDVATLNPAFVMDANAATYQLSGHAAQLAGTVTSTSSASLSAGATANSEWV